MRTPRRNRQPLREPRLWAAAAPQTTVVRCAVTAAPASRTEPSRSLFPPPPPPRAATQGLLQHQLPRCPSCFPHCPAALTVPMLFSTPSAACAGSWLRGAYLLATSTAQPTLLGLPFGIAALGWAGGMVVLVVSGMMIVYCNMLLASLFEFGGRRHTTFRDMAHRVMGGAAAGPPAAHVQAGVACRLPQPHTRAGARYAAAPAAGHKYPRAYYAVLIPQFTVIVGVGGAWLPVPGSLHRAPVDEQRRGRAQTLAPALRMAGPGHNCRPTRPLPPTRLQPNPPPCAVANLILAGQCLQAVFDLYCGGELLRRHTHWHTHASCAPAPRCRGARRRGIGGAAGQAQPAAQPPPAPHAAPAPGTQTRAA